MAMNKVKSPLVKVLRKAGYSVKEAMSITLDAQHNFHNARECSRKAFNQLSHLGCIAGMFGWRDTSEGIYFWSSVQSAISRS